MIALDSNVFIYLLNAHPEFGPRAEKAVRLPDVKVASELIFAEIFSSPKLNDTIARHETEKFLEALRVLYVPINKKTTLLAGELRRKHKVLALADALHIASALEAGADTFITNDKALAKLKIPGLHVTTLWDYTKSGL